MPKKGAKRVYGGAFGFAPKGTGSRRSGLAISARATGKALSSARGIKKAVRSVRIGIAGEVRRARKKK